MENIKFQFLTSNNETKSHKDYQKISDLLNDMIHSDAIALGAGFCVSLCSMVKLGLKQRGIESRMIECQLTLSYKSQEKITTGFIGFSDVRQPGEIDTHIVIVTETDPPFLIDPSISHRLPNQFPAIVEPISNLKNKELILLDQDFVDAKLHIIYQEKIKQTLPQSHQMSILDRIKTDKKITDDIRYLKTLNIVGIIISIFALLNVIANILKLYG